MEKINFNPVKIWVKKRIKNKNQNVIMVINGATGSGKTYAGLTLGSELAEEFGTPFSIKNNVDFNFAGLLLKTMDIENNKPGNVFLFEEVGAIGSGSAARQWQSKANRLFLSFLQTTRHRQQVLIFTCPHFSFLDAGARSLVHMQVEMQSIDYKKRIATARPYRVQVNSRTGKIYFKFLRFRYKNKRLKYKMMEIKHPSEELAKDYEIVKRMFTTALNKSIIEDSKPKQPKKKLKCLQIDCGYVWMPRGTNPTKYCPKCRTKV